MSEDFVKSNGACETQPQSTSLVTGTDHVLAPPSTAKKRHVFGRSSSARVVGPIRLDPELSEIFSDLARKERRSHGDVCSRTDAHDWAPSNNTIPETLNSSKEWKVPNGMDKKYASSQNDVRSVPDTQVLEATPSKNQHGFFSRAPSSFDKENFFTPRKNVEGPPATPVQSRCPLSALPVDTVPSHDVSDGVHAVDIQSGSARKYGSAANNSHPNNDCGIFRTPQLKTNQPIEVPKSRQRLYAVSQTSSKYELPQVPLHPAVLAGQQEAKLLQMHRESQPSSVRAEPSTSRNLLDSTPFKTAPNLQQPRPTFGFRDSHSSNENLSSSKSWLSHSKPAEIASQTTSSAHEKARIPSITSTESTWLPVAKYPHLAKHSSKVENHSTGLKSALSQDPVPTPSDTPQDRCSSLQRVGKPSEMPLMSSRMVSKVENHSTGLKSALSQDPIPTLSDTPQDRCSSFQRVDKPSEMPQISSRMLSEPSKDIGGPTPAQGSKLEPGGTFASDNVDSVAAPPVNTIKNEFKQMVVNSTRDQLRVNGHAYDILSLLGRGGSSKVYQVLDPETSQLKAVKCVNLAETDPSICDGYLNEIKLLADLQDGDCVIRMFDHEHHKESNTLYVVMEKGDTDLSKLIKDLKNSKKISATMIAYYWTEMLNAVSFIHKRGTIHSDLKPANFLLVSGRLKLIDFGIASSVQEDMTSVMKDSLTGTYNYISPEALSTTSSDGHQFKISYKSDVWSLGCILYNLVYGRTPFQHITGQFQKLNAIVSSSHRIQFPDPPISDCPSSLIQAMKLCLVRNPKERASVDELLQIPYLGQVGPERAILSKVVSLTTQVGLVPESEANPFAAAVRAIQRLLMENEKHLSLLMGSR